MGTGHAPQYSSHGPAMTPHSQTRQGNSPHHSWLMAVLKPRLCQSELTVADGCCQHLVARASVQQCERRDRAALPAQRSVRVTRCNAPMHCAGGRVCSAHTQSARQHGPTTPPAGLSAATALQCGLACSISPPSSTSTTRHLLCRENSMADGCTRPLHTCRACPLHPCATLTQDMIALHMLCMVQGARAPAMRVAAFAIAAACLHPGDCSWCYAARAGPTQCWVCQALRCQGMRRTHQMKPFEVCTRSSPSLLHLQHPLRVPAQSRPC